MADHSPSGAGLPQNQNEELNEAAPISTGSHEVENENEEEAISLEDESEEDEEDQDESQSERDSEEDEEEEEDDEVSQGNQWSRSEIDGLFCSICLEAWTTYGDHHICCLPCGHIFGMSCIQRWLKRRRNQAKCPQCNCGFALKDVRKLYASRVIAVDEEAQKRIQSLEKKCARLQSKNEAKFLDCLQKIADSISARSKSDSQSNSGPSLRVLCQQILHSMNLDPGLYMGSLEVFVKEPGWCEFFINMDEELRRAWLKYHLQPPLPPPSTANPPTS